MPLIGPAYFNTVSDIGGGGSGLGPYTWSNPSFAENAPDGNSTVITIPNGNSGPLFGTHTPQYTNILAATSWQEGSAIWAVHNCLVEFYGSFSNITFNYIFTMKFGGVSYGQATGSILGNSSILWRNVNIISSNYNGVDISNLEVDLQFWLQDQSGTIFIDSIRVTLDVAVPDVSVYPDISMYSKKSVRKFKSRRTNKIISQVRIRGRKAA